MRCPFCKQDNDRVVDSRSTGEGASIRRRRECLVCGRRYTTYESITDQPLMVVKKNGVRETFDREKILKALRIACNKTPVSADEMERITEDIERRSLRLEEREIPSRLIGEWIMEHLRNANQVAYVRFASVYRAFHDLRDFENALRPLRAEGAGQ